MNPDNTGYMAVKITEDNIENIRIVNGGVVPALESVGCYFVFPYDFDSHCEILTEEAFRESFRFMNDELVGQFVDCIKL